MRIHSTIATFALTTSLVVGLVGPASAGARPRIDLRGGGAGSYVLDDSGSAQLAGAVTGAPFDGDYTATLSADDGGLPDPGACEPATASLHVRGSRSRYLVLAATGEVCGLWGQDPYVVSHRFVGRYVVEEASQRKLRGTDGWISESLATEGRADVEAIDT